jgi:uncharacterized phiE125 gp8 family phage protein
MSAITLTEAKSFLQIVSAADDALIALLVQGAEDWVAAQCGVVIGERSCVDDLDGGGRLLALPGRPALAVLSVLDRADDSTVDPAGYQLRRDALLIAGGGRWPDGVARYRVTYLCGYALAEDATTTTAGAEYRSRPLPDALKAAVLHLTRRAYDNRGGAGLEIVSGWHVQWDSLADGQVAALVQPWREMGV